MVESLTREDEWVEVLRYLPTWEVPNEPILVIAPHPDDETLGAGGLIAAMRQRGVEITVVAVTDGEHAYPENEPQQVKDLGQLRVQEQAHALGHLGVQADRIVRLGLPDSAVKNSFGVLVDHLLTISTPDTHIVAPWCDDFHPDHRACGLAAEEVARRTGARLSSYFFWTWHQGSVARVRELSLRRFPLTPALLHAKSMALESHQSQLYRDCGDPILPENLLAPARRSFETFLVAE